MRKIVVLASMFLVQLSFSQNGIKFCGHGEVMDELLKKDPSAKQRIENNNKFLADADAIAFKNGYENYPNGYFNLTNKANLPNSSQSDVYTIPVVFHVLHQNGFEKISPDQIKDAIRILNVDYNKLNQDTSDVISDFISRIGDVKFNFVLASKDPLGNCTNGIVYHESTQTDWTSGDPGPFTGTSANKWNPMKYLNIYTVKTISSGAAGYTYLPGSWSTGSGNDCIIILHNYVGSIGTGQVSKSRALTHEVGHWFNLPHVWGGNNTPGTACGDEGVSDTPVTKGFDYCPAGALQSQICNTGVSENYQNYMDYSYCSVMFTTGQATRMRTSINSSISGRNNLWSTNNLTFTGVSNPQPCLPQAYFTTVSNKKLLCTGSNVQFKDSTWNTTVSTWQWSFPGGTPNTSTDSMPLIIYNTPGIYPVSYTATNTAGSSSVSKNAFINVRSNVASLQGPYVENFENIYFPSYDWFIENTSDTVKWMQDTTIGSSGNNCIKIDNYNNSVSKEIVFYTPSYNISQIVSTNPGAVFNFKLAYQRRTTNSIEKLQVFSSINCGQSWTQRYSKTTQTTSIPLQTVSAINANPFIPLATDWRTESVSINALTTQTNVLFKFVFTSAAAGLTNNIYIDDINISNWPLAEFEHIHDNFNVFPNPTNGNFKTEFELIEKENVLIQFVDLLGKVQHELKLDNLNAGSHEFDIQVPTDLSNGIYFLKLNTNKGTKTIKMAIEK